MNAAHEYYKSILRDKYSRNIQAVKERILRGEPPKIGTNEAWLEFHTKDLAKVLSNRYENLVSLLHIGDLVRDRASLNLDGIDELIRIKIQMNLGVSYGDSKYHFDDVIRKFSAEGSI